jgi:hypothetical protein
MREDIHFTFKVLYAALYKVIACVTVVLIADKKYSEKGV